MGGRVVSGCRYLLGEIRSLDLELTEAVLWTAQRPKQMTHLWMALVSQLLWEGGEQRRPWRQELKSCWSGHPGEPDKVKTGPAQIRPVQIKRKGLGTSLRKWLRLMY